MFWEVVSSVVDTRFCPSLFGASDRRIHFVSHAMLLLTFSFRHVPESLAYDKKTGRRIISANDYGTCTCLELYSKRNFFSRSWHAQLSCNHLPLPRADFRADKPTFNHATMNWKQIYRGAAQYLLNQDGVTLTYGKGQQENTFTGYPYTPIRLDPRFGKPARTPLTKGAGFDDYDMGNSNVCGRDSLSEEHK